MTILGIRIVITYRASQTYFATLTKISRPFQFGNEVIYIWVRRFQYCHFIGGRYSRYEICGSSYSLLLDS